LVLCASADRGVSCGTPDRGRWNLDRREKPHELLVLPIASIACGRRTFCKALVAGAATGLSGCINFGELSSTYDAGGGATPDLAGGDLAPPSDLAGADLTGTQAMCPPAVIDTRRPPSSFSVNTATYYGSAFTFVCRDGSGLYALTAVCTHNGCPVDVVITGGFHCNCHGSSYDFNGQVAVPPTGPAMFPLKHYALCLTVDGTVGFDIDTEVAAAVRYSF
jgi:cytochrome b6-f complex iron-sulfur subunit